MNEVTWNEYIDLVKKECERRFDEGERYTIMVAAEAIKNYQDYNFKLYDKVARCALNRFTYAYSNRSRSIHLQPRLDWLESLKE